MKLRPTMCGSSQIVIAKNPIKHCVWLVVALFAVIMVTYQTCLICLSYLSYPKKTSVEIVYDEVPFPAITLCNHRPIDFYEEHKKQLKRKESVDSNSTNNAPVPFREQDTIMDSIKNEAAISEEEFIMSSTFYDTRNKSYWCDFEELYDSRFGRCFTYTAEHLTGPDKGFWARMLTGSGMLTENANDAFFKNAKTDVGLSGQEDGVRIFIHHPKATIVPNFETGGFDVPPGHTASFTYKTQRTIRAGSPYGNCSQTIPFVSNGPAPYRQSDCERMCLQLQVMKQCKCYDAHYTSALPGMNCWEESDKHDESFGVCSFSLENADGSKEVLNFTRCGKLKGCSDKCSCNIQCNSEVSDNETNCLYATRHATFKSGTCNCYPPCDEIEYDVSLSLSKWPSEHTAVYAFKVIFEEEDWIVSNNDTSLHVNYTSRFRYKFLNGKAVGFRDDGKYEFYANYVNKNPRKALEDVVTIRIMASDTKVVKTIETPLFTFNQLILAVGSQLGIWVGVALFIIIIVEVVELFLDALRNCCKQHTKKQPKELDVLKENVKSDEMV